MTDDVEQCLRSAALPAPVLRCIVNPTDLAGLLRSGAVGAIVVDPHVRTRDLDTLLLAVRSSGVPLPVVELVPASIGPLTTHAAWATTHIRLQEVAVGLLPALREDTSRMVLLAAARSLRARVRPVEPVDVVLCSVPSREELFHTRDAAARAAQCAPDTINRHWERLCVQLRASSASERMVEALSLWEHLAWPLLLRSLGLKRSGRGWDAVADRLGTTSKHLRNLAGDLCGQPLKVLSDDQPLAAAEAYTRALDSRLGLAISWNIVV